MRDSLGFLLWLVTLGRVVIHGNDIQLLAGATKTGCWFSMGQGMARIKCTACPFKGRKCLLESEVFEVLTVGELQDLTAKSICSERGSNEAGVSTHHNGWPA